MSDHLELKLHLTQIYQNAIKSRYCIALFKLKTFAFIWKLLIEQDQFFVCVFFIAICDNLTFLKNCKRKLQKQQSQTQQNSTLVFFINFIVLDMVIEFSKWAFQGVKMVLFEAHFG